MPLDGTASATSPHEPDWEKQRPAVGAADGAARGMDVLGLSLSFACDCFQQPIDWRGHDDDNNRRLMPCRPVGSFLNHSGVSENTNKEEEGRR